MEVEQPDGDLRSYGWTPRSSIGSLTKSQKIGIAVVVVVIVLIIVIVPAAVVSSNNNKNNKSGSNAPDTYLPTPSPSPSSSPTTATAPSSSPTTSSPTTAPTTSPTSPSSPTSTSSPTTSPTSVETPTPSYANVPTEPVNQITTAFFTGSGEDFSGFAIAFTDFNNDGLSDIVVGAPGENLVQIVYGTKTPAAESRLANLVSQNKGTLISQSQQSELGLTVVGGVDINGDQIQDVLIGAPFYNETVGAVYIVYGSPTFEQLAVEALNSSTGIAIFGYNQSEIGYTVGVGDFNNDGIFDFLIGCPTLDTTYLIWGQSPNPATISLSSFSSATGVVFYGISGTYFGSAVPPIAADINGDGIDDVVISAFDAQNAAGSVYVVYGQNSTYVWPQNITVASTTAPGFTFTGPADLTAGSTLAFVGDVNHDGKPDLGIGAPGGADNTGAAYFVFGFSANSTSVIPQSPSDFDGFNGFSVVNSVAYVYFGWSIAGVGDQNQDGIDDYAIGLPAAVLSGGDNNCQPAGAIVMLYGHSGQFLPEFDIGTDLTTQGIIFGLDTLCQSEFGYAIAGGADFNGDGRSEIAVGAPFYDYDPYYDYGPGFVAVYFDPQ